MTSSISDQRRYICSALVNSQTDEEMYDYLFSALDTMTPPLDPSTYKGTVLVDDIDLFSFVKDMYPSVTLKKIEKSTPKQLTQLYLTTNVSENDHHDLLTFSFSFYSNHRKAQFEIGLDRDGVLLTKDDESKDESNPENSTTFNTLYPYFLLLSDKPKSIQYFLEMIKGLVDKPQLKNIDVFLPESFYSIIPFIDFDKVLGTFPSIMLYKKDGSVNSITYSETGNTLRIKPITSVVTNEMVKRSLGHILIDYNEKSTNENEIEAIRQSIIDTVSQFHEKVLWSGDTSDFHKTLSRYTNHGKIGKKVTFSFAGKKQTLKKLIGYQWKKPFPLFKEKSKEEMDTLMRLAMMAPNCKDMLEIIIDKRTNIRGKIKKFLQLNIL